jgi:hypothetical protein
MGRPVLLRGDGPGMGLHAPCAFSGWFPLCSMPQPTAKSNIPCRTRERFIISCGRKRRLCGRDFRETKPPGHIVTYRPGRPISLQMQTKTPQKKRLHFKCTISIYFQQPLGLRRCFCGHALQVTNSVTSLQPPGTWGKPLSRQHSRHNTSNSSHLGKVYTYSCCIRPFRRYPSPKLQESCAQSPKNTAQRHSIYIRPQYSIPKR